MYRLLTLTVLCQLPQGFGEMSYYRLNTLIKPKAYSIAITPYFDTNDTNAFTFVGEVDITFTTESVTRQIKLHSQDLLYDDDNIKVLNGTSNIQLNASNPLIFDTNYTFAFINLQDDLRIGFDYSVKIKYRGPIRKDFTGFYKSHYTEGGAQKWLGATQMEPVSARKVFPCFDEPGLKATFSLSIDRPYSYKPSLSNTEIWKTVPLSNGYIREMFYPTPIMSTYLVAFVVSELVGVERVNGVKEFSIYTRPEALNQSDYALNFGIKVADALGAYFGIDYYSTNAHLKLKHVAIPDFTHQDEYLSKTHSDAMENWGLVTYWESSVLYSQKESRPSKHSKLARMVTHETSHMWLGNIVTCHWWSDVWLNEGFAHYFGFYFSVRVDPYVAPSSDVVELVLFAYSNDPAETPISNENVNSPTEIVGHLSSWTSYPKAGAVIRMMHHFIGDAAFRHGMNNYLETNKFSSGTPEKLYNALEIGVQNTSSLAMYPYTNITEVMSSWISQAGHPVLQVDINYENDSVLLTQKRFYLNSSHYSNETYNIPITYTTGVNPDFLNTTPVFVMKNKTHQFSIPEIHQDRRWVIFNIQETGIYRVNYDNQTWKAIAKALKGSDREKIHPLNRAKIVHDLLALFSSGEGTSDRLQDMFEVMSTETDYGVWYCALYCLNKMVFRSHKPQIQKMLQSGVEKVGYAVGANDTQDMLRNREQILLWACVYDVGTCREHFVTLFQGLKDNGTEITPSLRPVAYRLAMKFGGKSDYKFLEQRMLTTNIASEANDIKTALQMYSNN